PLSRKRSPVAPSLSSLILFTFHLIPVSTAKNGVSGRSRKRILPDPVTEPPVTDPVYEARLYCNIPSVAERSMEGHAPHHFKLVSVHVLIRHGDRYPLYVIPKTKRPEIDCTLVANRKPYHPKLEAFVSHMSKGPGASFESPLHSLPLYPNHPLCEMGELTQTGTCGRVPSLASCPLLHLAHIWSRGSCAGRSLWAHRGKYGLASQVVLSPQGI
uniref:2-phosphoxylose phosphatase 1 n=1 Tax=Equus asinus asinus TaxID=83772 RepID=A0A8C4L2Y0_EQUAS